MSSQGIVHVIDDDPAMRKSLRLVLESESLVVSDYASAEEFFDLVDRNLPGCILLDLRMPGMSGFEVLQSLQTMNLGMPPIVMTGDADVPSAIRAMKLGAVDLMQKPFEWREMLEAVARAIETSVKSKETQTERQRIGARLAKLTPRELDLLKLVVGGMPNKKIAFTLGISIKTVANHRASLMAKTEALNAADLARISTVAGIPLKS